MGLYDRSYMRNDQNKTQGMSGRQMLICLIILNIAAFFIVHGKMFDALALTVGRGGFKISYLWQLFTAGFLHPFQHVGVVYIRFSGCPAR